MSTSPKIRGNIGTSAHSTTTLPREIARRRAEIPAEARLEICDVAIRCGTAALDVLVVCFMGVALEG